MNLWNAMFPTLHPWAKVELTKLAEAVIDSFEIDPAEPNPFLDQDYRGKWMKLLSKFLKTAYNHGSDYYTYGGYLEDRSVLWAGHYMNPDEMIHLGVDYNVPAGTEVHLPFTGTLMYAKNDGDQNGGWGGKVIFKPNWTNKLSPYFIFGHLDNFVTEMREYEAGEVIGVVGERGVNGGWYPHLHVQCMRAYEPEVDGYGKMADDLEVRYPDPNKF